METRVPKNHWLRINKIAHRGLWDSISPENSLPAFENAAKLSMAVEIDVYLTTDGEVVVFHDDNLKRMTGIDKLITDCTLAELKTYSLARTEHKIPTLKELFEVAEGKSPLLIEIKSRSTKVGELEKALYELLKDYKGEFAIQSFNPFSVLWFTKNAPHMLRGQLSTYFTAEDNLTFHERFLLKRLFFNFKTKPDFVSYDQRYMPNAICKIARAQGKVLIAWTVTSKEREQELDNHSDNIIFENYIPDVLIKEEK